jgi:chaperonin GroES
MVRKPHLTSVPGEGDPRERVHLTGDRIVVHLTGDRERKSRSGLLIPATAAPAPKRCIWADVELVGPDVRVIKVRDRVAFLPQSGLEVEIGGDDYLLLRERDIQAVAETAEGREAHPGQYL